MVSPNFNSLCEEAELYYCDFLCKEGHKLVPEFIIDHIKQCQCCQEQLSRLTRVLSIGEGHIESEQRQVSSAITIMLKLHLAYIGKPVTCEIVKPFLPSLLDPALEIGIPTPITVHLDNCQTCSEDLEVIRRLNLNRKQLRRLSQLFVEEPPKNSAECSEMAEMAKSVAAMDFGRTTAEVLQHLCKCPVCRGTLYEERQKMCDSLSEYEYSPEFPCESVSATDIFDYVVPYGLDFASDQYAKFRESLTSHLRICPNCLAKMQELHKTIYGICERPESEVITVYHVDESAKAQATSGTEELYAGFPIKVDVKQREEVKAEQPIPAIDFGTALRQKVSVTNLKPLLKTGAVAAAVILMAVVLFQNIPTAKAVTLERIYEAIEKIKNVHIASFIPDKKEPIQEQWVSKTANTYMLKTERQLVLWNIPNRVRKSKELDADSVETSPLSTEMITEIEGTIGSFGGLVPFANISVIPPDAKWEHVIDDSSKIADGVEVYDLTWTERVYDGSTVSKKWRFFVNAKADLPQKIEIYQILPTDTEYILKSLMVVEYLSENEVQKIIKEASF